MTQRWVAAVAVCDVGECFDSILRLLRLLLLLPLFLR